MPPETMIRRHVRLGALRGRHDALLAAALLGNGSSGAGDGGALQAVLARHRALAAHEIGHSLGPSERRPTRVLACASVRS